MKNKILKNCLSFFLIMMSIITKAQISPVSPGDVLPEEFWNISYEMVDSINLKNLRREKDKLIILDFWATNCSGCLINFPKLEGFQEQFGNKIKIIPVTYQPKETIQRFYSSDVGKKYKKLGSIVSDSLLNQFFPHVGIPFYVWIKDGKLVNTTDASQLKAENIAGILENKFETLQTVVQMTRDRPFMLSENFDRQRNISMLNYSIFIQGLIPDIGAGNALKFGKTGLANGRQYTNLPLFDILFSVGFELFTNKNKNELLSENRIILNVSDTLKLKGKIDKDGMVSGDLYSYELIVPDYLHDSLYSFMLKDLNNFSPFISSFEKRIVTSFVLKRTTSKDKLATKGGEYICSFPRTPSILNNAPLDHMVNMLNGNTFLKLPVINETGYTGNVDLKISEIKSLKQLNKELSNYDLMLVKEERELLMMVISEK